MSKKLIVEEYFLHLYLLLNDRQRGSKIITELILRYEK